MKNTVDMSYGSAYALELEAIQVSLTDVTQYVEFMGLKPPVRTILTRKQGGFSPMHHCCV